MRLTRLTGAAQLLAFHDEVLRPAFPPEELAQVDGLRVGVDTGTTEVWAVSDRDGRLLGGVVGDWSLSSRVMLLSYLAVVVGGRGGGVGSYLYDRVIRNWAVRYRPCLILAEVEHPDRHQGSAAYGDPVARLRFYQRHGGRALDLPYFQPSLAPGQPRVHGMMLLALHVDPELTGENGDGTVAAQPLRTFLTEYLTTAEGAVPDDPATVALWRALEASGGVPVSPPGVR